MSHFCLCYINKLLCGIFCILLFSEITVFSLGLFLSVLTIKSEMFVERAVWNELMIFLGFLRDMSRSSGPAVLSQSRSATYGRASASPLHSPAPGTSRQLCSARFCCMGWESLLWALGRQSHWPAALCKLPACPRKGDALVFPQRSYAQLLYLPARTVTLK